MSEWIDLNTNGAEFAALIGQESDCWILFDNGDVIKHSCKNWPFAMATHFKPITNNRLLLERALEALHKSCTYCENESLSEHCGACKHGIVIKDIEKHLKGGKE